VESLPALSGLYRPNRLGERETLWARHYALPLANSLIVASFAISPNKWAALAMPGTLASHSRRMVSNHSLGMVGDAAALQSRRDICPLVSRTFPIPSRETSAIEQSGIHRMTLLTFAVRTAVRHPSHHAWNSQKSRHTRLLHVGLEFDRPPTFVSRCNCCATVEGTRRCYPKCSGPT
jgi:hypothetical protein